MSVADVEGVIEKLNVWCMEYILASSSGTVCIDHWEQNNKVSWWPIYIHLDVK